MDWLLYSDLCSLSDHSERESLLENKSYYCFLIGNSLSYSALCKVRSEVASTFIEITPAPCLPWSHLNVATIWEPDWFIRSPANHPTLSPGCLTNQQLLFFPSTVHNVLTHQTATTGKKEPIKLFINCNSTYAIYAETSLWSGLWWTNKKRLKELHMWM